MRTYLTVLLASLLAACATSPDAVKAVADAQAELAKIKTFEGECSAGCKFSYTDPRDRAHIRLPTNGWDAAIAITGSGERLISGAVLPAAGIAIVREVRKAGAGGNTSTTTTTTTTNTASGAGASTSGAASYHTEQIGPDSQNNTSGDTTTTTTTDNHSATAPPTIVNQPAPVIVHPTIVNPIIHEVAP